jgi:hypothetical protein
MPTVTTSVKLWPSEPLSSFRNVCQMAWGEHQDRAAVTIRQAQTV